MYPYITDNEGLNSGIPSFQNTVKNTFTTLIPFRNSHLPTPPLLLFDLPAVR